MQSEYKTFSKLTKPIYVNPLSLGFLHQDPAKSSSLGLLPFLFLGDGRTAAVRHRHGRAPTGPPPLAGKNHHRSQARITTGARAMRTPRRGHRPAPPPCPAAVRRRWLLRPTEPLLVRRRHGRTPTGRRRSRAGATLLPPAESA